MHWAAARQTDGEATMNDFEMNPMKTGLMFVPLGPTGHQCSSGSRRSRHHLAELEAELESAIGPEPEVESAQQRRQIFHRLINCVRQFIPQLHLQSRT
jgi:hypothetical protein